MEWKAKITRIFGELPNGEWEVYHFGATTILTNPNHEPRIIRGRINKRFETPDFSHKFRSFKPERKET